MRIALITPEWDGIGGIATYSRIMADGLAASGNLAGVIALSEGRGSYKYPVFTVGRSTPLQQARDTRTAFDALRSLVNVDLVECADYLGMAGGLADALDGTPLVTRLHLSVSVLSRLMPQPSSPGVELMRREARRLERRQLGISAATTYPTIWVASCTETIARVRLPDPCRIPNPLEDSWFIAPKSQSSYDLKARPSVLHIGRPTPRKGVYTLRAAWASPEIQALKPLLRVAGSSSVDDDPRQGVEALGAISRDELPRLIDRADAAVFPAPFDNFPYAVLECMARGLPVVVTKGHGLAEYLEHGIDSVLTESLSPDALVRGIVSLLRGPAVWRESMASRALKKAESWRASVIVPQVIEMYLRTIRKGV